MHASDLRTVLNAMLYIAPTGCQWRFLPDALAVLHAVASEADGRAEAERGQ